MVYSKLSKGLEILLVKSMLGIIRLLHLKDHIYFVVTTSILGISSSNGEVGWRFLILLLANLSAVSFAFIVDDIEDAPEDVLSTLVSNHNPISTGLISPKTARFAAFFVAALSIVFYALLGIWPLILGLLILIFGFLSSLRGVRLKSLVAYDIFACSLMLAGLPFLSAHFTYAPKLTQEGFWPFIFVMSISLSATLYNKLSQTAVEKRTSQERHAPSLSDRSSRVLLILMLLITVFSGVITIFVIELIPLWVYGIMAILTFLFVIPAWLSIRKGRKILRLRNLLLKPLTRAAAIALILQYLVPWLGQI